MASYICSSCSYGSASWYGKCPSCGAWNTLSKQEAKGDKKSRGAKAAKLTNLKTVVKASTQRLSTKIYEIDRVLGGGFRSGQMVLLAGEPGVGKSTLLLKGLSSLPILYVSGEESVGQIADRASRLGASLDHFFFTEETQVESIIEAAKDNKNDFVVMVVDSVQTIHSADAKGGSGGVTQIRESLSLLSDFAKQFDKVIVVVGHVTKGGDIAGPKTLEHLVDTVLYLEGDKNSSYRILRARKNRFGTTEEVGLFEMTQSGLKQVKNPVAFIKQDGGESGRAITAAVEGSRALFFEIQSLVVPTSLPSPRRVASGIEFNRLQLILAALRKHLHLSLDGSDVYVSVVGGLSVRSPSVDLGVAASIYSSAKNKPIASGSLFIGELGLLGEVRSAFREEMIEKEARRFGFKKIYSSKNLKKITDFSRVI